MGHWSDFLDFNFLRPSAFERRHRIEEQHYQRPTSNASLPNNLPSRSALNALSPSSNLDPSSSYSSSSATVNQGHFPTLSPSLSSQRRASISNTPSLQSRPSFFQFRTLSYQDAREPSITNPHSSLNSTLPTSTSTSNSTFTVPSFARGQSLTPPTLNNTPQPRSRQLERRENSLDIDPPSESRSMTRFWRAITGRSITTSPRSQSSTTSTNPRLIRTEDGQQQLNPELDEQEDQARLQHQQRHSFNLPRLNNGTDMTPRTSRLRRPVEEDMDEDSTQESQQQQQQQIQGNEREEESSDVHGVVIVVPPISESSPIIAVTSGPSLSRIDSALACTNLDSLSTSSLSSSGIEEGRRLSADADGRQNTTQVETSSPEPSTAPSLDPNPNPLVRLSTVESRTGVNVMIPIPLTAEERRILNNRAYLKKFICVIATLPVLATLAIHNRIELMMWWVIMIPITGITIAVLWRWKLGVKLKRLREEAVASRVSLMNPSNRNLTRSYPLYGHTDNSSNDPETGTPPPPDYQSSIITPPAYVLAQQPRKVPSYRSLENLFSLARQSAIALSRSTTRRSQGSAAHSSSEYLPQASTNLNSSSSTTDLGVANNNNSNNNNNNGSGGTHTIHNNSSSSLQVNAIVIDMDQSVNLNQDTLYQEDDKSPATSIQISSSNSLLNPTTQSHNSSTNSGSIPEMVEIHPTSNSSKINIYNLEDQSTPITSSSHLFLEGYNSNGGPSTSRTRFPFVLDEVTVDQENSTMDIQEDSTAPNSDQSQQSPRDLKGKSPMR